MNKQLKISSVANRHREVCTDGSSILPVKQGLAMKPSEIASMSERGFAVSAQMDETLFYDGDDGSLIDVPIERLRGIDAAEVWEIQQSAKRKLINAHNIDIEKYGD